MMYRLINSCYWVNVLWCWCWCRWGDSALSTGDKASAGYGNELQGTRAGRAAVCRDRWSAAVVSCRRRAATAVPCRPLVLSRVALFSHQSPAVVFSIVNYVSPAPRDQNVCSRLPPGSLASLRPYDNRENCSNLPSVFFKYKFWFEWACLFQSPKDLHIHRFFCFIERDRGSKFITIKC